MTRHYHLETVFLSDGWVSGAMVTVADDGFITGIETHDVAPESVSAAESVPGVVVPGMPNAHSHAFQRGMAGNTEYRLSSQDSFWTWRQTMYALANRIGPAELQILATQLFIEMLKSGYTCVAEFHYLHRQPDGGFYPDGHGMWDVIIAAAAETGIGLTLLPTLYQTGDFDAQPLKREQSRFALSTERFVRSIEDRIGAERRGPSATLRTGAAFHSLRAVPLDVLRETTLALRQLDASIPIHIHVAEQSREVDSCVLATGRRPIELLLETGLVDRHWCLVHATYASAAELRSIASGGATVCLSISTEANLGDGFFDAATFLAAGGHVCVGSDSQASVSPAEELRWMEYQQRLLKTRRGVLSDESEPHLGTRLWRDAAQYGAQAIGQRVGTLAVGHRADWLVLDRTHASMAGARPAGFLDHLLFAGGQAAIRDVMVAGRWVVRDGRHDAELPLRSEFTALMGKLAG